jgi:hypothetical protein
LVRNGSEKLLVRVDARAAELEDFRMCLGSPHDSSNRFRNVVRIGRLQSGPAAAEHRIDWKLAKELEDGCEKRVVRSEHHRRADEKRIGERCADRQFAFAALSDVAGWRASIGPDAGNVNKPLDSSPVRLNCYPLSRLDMNGMKSLRSVLDVKTDRIYNAVSAGQRLRD